MTEPFQKIADEPTIQPVSPTWIARQVERATVAGSHPVEVFHVGMIPADDLASAIDRLVNLAHATNTPFVRIADARGVVCGVRVIVPSYEAARDVLLRAAVGS